MRGLRRGQAATEMAVSVIFIIPLVLYTIFLDDLLHYKLDLMEAVTMAPWDSTVIDYEKAKTNGTAGAELVNGTSSPAKFVRLNWCDHTTAYNSYDGNYDCDEGVHHKALAAHACWIVAQPDGENQVQCSVDNEAGKEPFANAIPGLGTAGLADEMNAGGMVSCTARLGVVNYFLWDKMFMMFSKADLSNKNRFGTAGQLANDVHGDATGQSSVWLLERQHAAVITDTWALTTRDAVQPGGPPSPTSNSLYKRVDKATSKIPPIAGLAYGAMLIGKQLLSPLALIDGPMGHTLTTTSMAWTPNLPPMPPSNNFYASPWRPVKVQDTYNARGQYYMGLQQPPN